MPDADRSKLDRALEAVISSLPEGIDRPGQVSMAHAVADALDTRRHLLVQAGTGTGKGVAYLVPALLLGKPVIVSTSTKALQSQLIDSDLPRILDALEPIVGRRAEVAVIKGRANYLCKLKLSDSPGEDRVQELLPGLTEDDGQVVEPARPSGRGGASSLGKAVVALRKWAEQTDTGDQAELPATIDFDSRAWSLLSVSARECLGRDKCSMGETCFAELARDRAADADIVVTNHHLLALDIQTEGRLLPDHRAVIVDEAHDVIDRVTSACAEELSLAALERMTTRLPLIISEDAGVALGQAVADVALATATTMPGPLRPVPEHLALPLRNLDVALTKAMKELIAAQGALTEDKQSTAQVLRASGDAALSALDRIVAGSLEDVAWLEAPEGGRPVLRVAPLDVSQLLGDRFFTGTTAILTSATLRAGGDFTALATRLGLTESPVPGPATNPGPGRWDALDVGSPFDYDTQGILYVAADLPDPSSSREGHSEAMRDRMVELVRAAGGRCLGLFTSHAAAARAADEVRRRSGKRVLLQGDAPLPRLVEQFRAEPSTCLFGSLSLWQGVDVPGASCQLVVIDKLPFPRPDDPLPAARKAAVDARGGNGFTAVYATTAASLLAQGVGRLIRADADRGVVAVLDPRLQSKSYGQAMLRELPPLRRLRDLDLVLAALRRIDS